MIRPVRRPSAELQSFGREARRLLRHSAMREILSAEEREYASELTVWYLEKRFRNPKLPAHMKRKIHQIVRSAQRSVDNCATPVAFYTEYSETVLSALRLLTGHFCGRTSPMVPNSQCSICLCARGSNWWFSWRCGHYFHTKCIGAHACRDNRCPLCRAEFL